MLVPRYWWPESATKAPLPDSLAKTIDPRISEEQLCVIGEKLVLPNHRQLFLDSGKPFHFFANERRVGQIMTRSLTRPAALNGESPPFNGRVTESTHDFRRLMIDAQ